MQSVQIQQRKAIPKIAYDKAKGDILGPSEDSKLNLIIFLIIILFAHLHIYFTKLHYYTTYITILKLHTTQLHPCSTSRLQFHTSFLLPTLQETNKQNKTNTEINMYHLLRL